MLLPTKRSGQGYLVEPEPAARKAAQFAAQNLWMRSRSPAVPLLLRDMALLGKEGLKNVSPATLEEVICNVIKESLFLIRL
jgi:hypothetical protein